MCSLKAVGHPLAVSAKNRVSEQHSIEALVIGESLCALGIGVSGLYGPFVPHLGRGSLCFSKAVMYTNVITT